MPKVSIIIPVYNVEKYLVDCLVSVTNQTLQDIEIICVNDGSTDNSLKILERYQIQDSRVKIINKKNSGYGNSMNMGLDMATGEYIGIVESDDFIKVEMFEKLYELASKNDADIVKSDYYKYKSQNQLSIKAGKMTKYKINKLINAEKYPKILGIQPCIWSAIYKREFLLKNNIRFLETPGASYQDTSFAFKALASAEKIFFTPKSYLYYRIDNENSSVHSKEKVYCICNEYDEITKFLNANKNIKNFANSQKLINQYSAYAWNLKRIDEQFKDEFINLFSHTFRTYFDNGEVTKDFYKCVDKKEFDLLLNNTKEYRTLMNEIATKENNKKSKDKKFSLRINKTQISLIINGKKLIEVE